MEREPKSPGGEEPEAVTRRELGVLASLVALLVAGLGAAWAARSGCSRASLEIRPAAPEAIYRVNVNTADEGELAALPGIGPVRAAKIVAYRRAHGSPGERVFGATRDLVDAGLVPESVYRRIRGSITVGPGERERR
jgi:hypothetical protein